MPAELLNGVIADTPLTVADLVRVSVPNLNMLGRRTYGPLGFRPRITAEGGVLLPVSGDTCLLAVDREGPAWIVEWAHDDPTTPALDTIAALSGITSSLDNRLDAIEAGIPHVHLSRNAVQTIPNAAVTAISWDTAVENNFGMWSAGNPTRITIPIAGIYCVGGWFRWAPNATGVRAGHLRTGGSNFEMAMSVPASAVADNTDIALSVPSRRWSAGEYIELTAFQRSTVGLDIQSSAGIRPAMWATRIGD